MVTPNLPDTTSPARSTRAGVRRRPFSTVARTIAGRRVILVLTAGQSMRDSGSRREAVRQIQRADTMAYAVGFRQSGLTRQIRELAEESGGGYVEYPQGLFAHFCDQNEEETCSAFCGGSGNVVDSDCDHEGK